MKNLGHGIMGSNSTSGKMKASNVQSMIKQAFITYSEQRRQNQSNLMPKQSKEASQKRPEEEARIDSKHEWLKKIDDAKKGGKLFNCSEVNEVAS